MDVTNIAQLWQSAWPAGVTMLGLGFCFALVLLIASEKLKVQVDPKVERIRGALPGIDCGACGFAGCGSYAKSVAVNPELIGRCAPGGAAVAAKIGEILSLQIEGSDVPLRPVVHCNAHIGDKTYLARYEGILNCRAANALANAQACKFGCLGYGDCVRACKFDALHMVEGLATVDYEKCTGCTACAKACPRNLIEMIPYPRDSMVVVACNSKENGKTVRSMCKVGCIGCGLCGKICDQFSMKDNLASLDYTNYRRDDYMDTAREKCPTRVIVCRGRKNIR